MTLSSNTVRVGAVAMWLTGLAVAIALVGLQGFREVGAALAVAGWGLVWVASVHVAVLLADTTAWRALILPHGPVSLGRLTWVRWLGESVNQLLPVASVGGDLLRAWLARRTASVPGALAGASVVVDMTLGVVTQILFTLIGLGVLVSLGAENQIIDAIVIGVGLLSAAMVAFILAQRAGLFAFSGRILESVATRTGWAGVVDDAIRLDHAIQQIYAARASLIASTVWRMLAWFIGTVEIWAGAWVLGHPLGFAEALMLESLVLAVRSALFVVPGGLGAQEGAFIVLGALVGLTPEVALALSLLKRIRELILGIPGLLSWQLSELHRVWVRTSVRNS